MLRLLAVSLLIVCPHVAAEEAANFHGNAAHTGVYSSQGATAFHKVKWQFHTRGQILSSPVVSGNSVYFGSNDHHVYALDLATGGEKWKFKTGSRVPSTPTVANGVGSFSAMTAISTRLTRPPAA